MKKIQVYTQMGSNKAVEYVTVKKNYRGNHVVYSEAAYKANPAQFEVVAKPIRESHRISIAHNEGRVVTSNRPLPKPLNELNEVIALLTPFRPNRTPQQIEAEAEKMVAEKHKFLDERKLTESWKERGLTEEAAGVAARQQIAMAPPASDLEFWSKFRF